MIKKQSPTKKNALTLFGTRKYENVWEAICRKITNDSLSDIKINFKKKFPTKKLFPSPIWNVLDIEFERTIKLIPDILSYNLESKVYYLFDAKYYSIQFEEDKIDKEPKYHDILKQFIYQQHLCNSLEKEIKNAFLLPILDNEFIDLKKKKDVDYTSNRAVIGSIKYKELFEDQELYVIMCPFSKWQEMYIKNKTLSFSEIEWKI